MDASNIRNVAVVGAGLMGHGIALEFALAGYSVTLSSRSEESLSRARQSIEASLSKLVTLGVTTPEKAEQAPSRIRSTVDLLASVESADVVVESVYEDLALKQRLFREVEQAAPDHAVFASNTSSFMPSQLASEMERADRLLVAHYINPPFLVPLVEVVPSESTSEEAVRTVTALLESVGKRPVVLRREVPGFIASRLQGALLREALWLVENGVASAQDVDTTITTSLGRRWSVAGVMEVLEIAGWDLIETIAASMFPHLASSGDVPQVLKERVERGELGLKSGKGFYEWTPESSDEVRQRIAKALVEIDRWT